MANTYNVEYSKEGYFTDTIEISLINGETITKNISLLPKESLKNGKIIDNLGNGIPNCQLLITNNFFRDTIITNEYGEFILDTIYQSDYNFTMGVGAM